jgi:hypothetical protein
MLAADFADVPRSPRHSDPYENGVIDTSSADVQSAFLCERLSV